MIAMTPDGTTVYITVDCFIDRFNFMPKDRPFVYATGDFLRTCMEEQDARALRHLLLKMERNGNISLAERELPSVVPGNRIFEYIAVKLVRTPAMRFPILQGQRTDQCLYESNCE